MAEKILVRADNELGYSYYLDDDYWYYDDWAFYDYDDDWYYDDYSDWNYYSYDDDGWYYDDYNDWDYYDDWDYYSYDNDSWYYDDYNYNDWDYYIYDGSYIISDYLNSYIDGYYDYYDCNNDYCYYDDYHYRYRNRENEINIYGDTLKVGSEYTYDIWLDDDYYSDVRVVDAGDNDHDLVISGNSRDNYIFTGDGDTTLWGGGGSSNTLQGSPDSRNMFWYTVGSKDYVIDFVTGDAGHSDIVMLSGMNWASINRDNTAIMFNMADGNFMRLHVTDSNDDKPILFSQDGINISKMKIARNDSANLTYTKDTDIFYFVQPGQLTIIDSDNDIWLGGEGGKTFTNVSTINASASYGNNTLAGNDQSNVIISGGGYTSLWGGIGNSADTLIGGKGVDNFFAGRFEGNDVIFTDNDYDLISLYDSNLSDIIYANVEDSAIYVGFNTGNVLTINNSGALTPTFQLKNGERYNFNRDTKQWQNA